jgi:hypothetical protein
MVRCEKDFVVILSKMRSSLRIVLTVVLVVLIALAALVFFWRFNFNFGNISITTLPIPVVSGSRNWAGYVVANNLFSLESDVQAVSGSWVVPSLKDTGADAYSSIWIGIGGQFDNTLIQVGTDQDFTGGTAKYYAWYEMLPNYLVSIDQIQVSPGDQIAASISASGLSNNSWTISIQDLTSNTKFQNTFTYSSKQLTAEWIVERPEVNNALTELANFGNVNFTNCQATISGKTGGITDFSYNYVILDPEVKNNQSTQLVTVSSPSNGGTQFKVTYAAG